ncbi:MAG: EAL domain-containing protein [Marinobacterium sp.]|nr:EAL domain-containing protein [Marinobacterium sp.]
MIRHLSIRRKLIVLVGVIMTGTILAVWLALQAFHQDMLADKRLQLTDVTRLMVNELGGLYRSDLSAEAQLAQARDMIHNSRYGDNDYFFLHNRSGVLVAHPVRKDLEGQNQLTLQDTDGRYIVRDMIAGIEKDGALFWTFKWPRPGENQPRPKLGYAMAIPDTDLIVGTGLYLDALDQAYKQRLMTTGTWLAALLLAVSVVALLIARSISRPIIALSRQMKRLARGDLQQTIVAAERKDEIGTMARSVRSFQYQAVENKRLQFMQEQTRFKNDFDPVTQLPNRQALNDAIDREVTRQAVCPEGFSVICFRLGNIHQLTMAHGEQTRDKMLVFLIRRLFTALNVGDVLSRIAEDAFCLLLPTVTTEEELTRLREELMRNIIQPIDKLEIDGEVVLDCYLGTTTYPNNGDQGFQLLGQAEIAANAAMQARQTWVAFETLDQETHDPHAVLWRELQEAIEEDQFRLMIQPIYDLKTETIVSAEVLLRWRHPTRGFVNPMSFIPQAEQNGMISRIDRWVLEAVAKQLKAWLDEGEALPRFAVNISGISFLRYDMPELAQSIFEQYLVPMKYLELELTEGVLIDEFSTVRDQMDRARAMGATVAIDDFGTGYSSISRIRNLSIDKVKIDRAFVNDIESSRQDLKLVEAIVHMSHGLDLTVVAEGVETRSQLEILGRAQCDLIQGYLLNRPLPPEEFLQQLQENRNRDGATSPGPRDDTLSGLSVD